MKWKQKQSQIQVENVRVDDIVRWQAEAKLDQTHPDVLETFTSLLNEFVELGEFTIDDTRKRLLKMLIATVEE